MERHRLYENTEYMEDIRRVSGMELPWDKLRNKKVLLSGATGMIGSFFIDVLLEKNRADDLNCKVYALTRSCGKAGERFGKYAKDAGLIIAEQDVKNPVEINYIAADETVDYVLHLASNTHPLQYATDPIGTISTNIFGLKNMLDFASDHHAERFAFASSNEIYGETRGDLELFGEDCCGYIDCNTLRAGYPESKRCGEALCQAYRAQIGMDIVIPRFTRTYGPTMLMSDTKAISQFIKKGISGEDIVLKSGGLQYYSYQYMADSAAGLMYVLLMGEEGEAYNIADESGDIRLKDIASLIAEIKGSKVIHETPEGAEAAGYSTATKARLDGEKLRGLGWSPEYDIKKGIERTMSILESISDDSEKRGKERRN